MDTSRHTDGDWADGLTRGPQAKMDSGGLHIVLDAQCLQTNTLQRGIGRYSLGLVRALATEFPNNKYTLLLNHITESKWNSCLAGELKDKAPNIHYAYFETPSAWFVQFRRARRVAEDSRERAINLLAPDAVVILSAMQGERQTVLSVRRKTRDIPTYAVLYDLIPLAHPEYFLYTRSLRGEYRKRLAVLSDCDGLLSISEATSESWAQFMGDARSITKIGGGGLGPSQGDVKFETRARKGVLAVGSETPNKNLGVLLKAHATLPKSVRKEHPLTVLGIREKGFRKYLRSSYPGDAVDLSVPGYVPDSELRAALEGSKLLVMPSTIEGLGLPVLEAMEVGTPCLVSATTSLAEICPNPLTHFGPFDHIALGRLINDLLTDEARWQQLQNYVIAEAGMATWSNVARRTINFVTRGLRADEE